MEQSSSTLRTVADMNYIYTDSMPSMLKATKENKRPQNFYSSGESGFVLCADKNVSILRVAGWDDRLCKRFV